MHYWKASTTILLCFQFYSSSSTALQVKNSNYQVYTETVSKYANIQTGLRRDEVTISFPSFTKTALGATTEFK